MSQSLRQRNFQSEATGSLLAFTIPHLMFNLNGKVMFDWQRVSAGLNSLSDALAANRKPGCWELLLALKSCCILETDCNGWFMCLLG